MAFNLNQFKLTNIIGLVQNPGANVIQCQVLPSLATTSYYSAGAVVYLAGGVSAQPIVALSASGSCGNGIIVFNAKKDTFYANDEVGVAIDGSIINCAAGAPIARQQVVCFGSVTANIPYVTGANAGLGTGIALDIALAAGDIIRVLVKTGIAYNATF